MLILVEVFLDQEEPTLYKGFVYIGCNPGYAG